jgi:hypothetical protein
MLVIIKSNNKIFLIIKKVIKKLIKLIIFYKMRKAFNKIT